MLLRGVIMKSRDYTGQKIGLLTVIGLDENYASQCQQRIANGEIKRYNNKWLCQCECGNITSISIATLKKGDPNLSCGCQKHYYAKDLTGQTFGKWTVLKRDFTKVPRVAWLCQCDCGKIHSVQGSHLKSGKSTKCKQCFLEEDAGKGNIKDLTGEKFGKLTVLRLNKEKTYRKTDGKKELCKFYDCQCECGNIETLSMERLTQQGWNECSLCRYKGFESSGRKGAYTRNQNIIKQKGSLLDILNERYSKKYISRIWSSRNKLEPWEITPQSHKSIYLVCPKCGTEYKTSALGLYSRVYEIMCPDCLRNITDSSLEKRTKEYLREVLKLTTLHEGDCTLYVINPKTGNRLLYDNEVVEHNLIIEVMGKQHYEELSEKSPWLNGLTPKQFLEDLQWRDNYKKEFAIANGYNYLAIPYWCFLDGSYTEMIEEVIT